MSRIRMNTEFRNKILNRYGESAEQEMTQEKDAFNDAREKVDELYPKAFELAKEVVSRAYPPEDVATCKSLKQNQYTRSSKYQKKILNICREYLIKI